MRLSVFGASTWLWVCERDAPFLLRAFHTPLMQHVTTVTHTAATRTHSSTMNPATLDAGTDGGWVAAAVELPVPVLLVTPEAWERDGYLLVCAKNNVQRKVVSQPPPPHLQIGTKILPRPLDCTCRQRGARVRSKELYMNALRFEGIPTPIMIL